MSLFPSQAARTLLSLIAASALAWGVGCDGTLSSQTPGEHDADTPHDAGEREDGGELTDGGSTPDGGEHGDGGAQEDAGTGTDGGSSVPDAGSGGDGGLVAWPDETNTGVPPGTTLTPGGSLTVTQAGQVVDGRDIIGSITVKANDVAVRNSKVTSSGTAIRLEDGFTRLTVEDVTLVGGAGVTDASKGISASAAQVTIRRVNLSGFPEGITLIGGGGLIEDNYFHDMPALTGGDGIEVWQGKSLVIRHNNIQRDAGNSVIKLPMDVPVPGGDDISIDGNLLAGGGWTVYGGYDPSQGSKSWTNVRITNNRFSVRFHPKCGVYGPIAYEDSSKSNGNVWHESGSPLSAPPPKK